MDCKKMESSLALYVEGDLGEDEAERVKSHLRNCPECRSLLKEYEKSETTLKDLHQCALSQINPPEIAPKVLARISAVRPRPARPGHIVIDWRYWLAAGIAAIVLLSVIYFTRGFETQNITPSQETLIATHPAPSISQEEQIASLKVSETPEPALQPNAPEPKTIKMVFYTPKYRIIWIFKEPAKIAVN